MDERPRGTKEPLLIGIENRHERHLGEVDPLTKEVDSDNHVEDAEAQVSKDLNAFERIDFAMEVAHANSRLLKVGRELFGHALRERGHDHALLLFHATLNALEEIVDLTLCRKNRDVRVNNASRPDQLLHHLVGALALITSWGR